jgi:hypothetical protein
VPETRNQLLVKIFGEQRNHFAPDYSLDGRLVPAGDEIRVANLVFAIEQIFYTLVDTPQHRS